LSAPAASIFQSFGFACSCHGSLFLPADHTESDASSVE
jgi:hypothetical protein